MKLSDKDFYTLVGAATAESDEDRFMADWGTSSVFYPDPDAEGPAADDVISELHRVYKLAHISIREIRQRTGLSQAAFAQRFCIPLRTVSNWENTGSNARTCPIYVRIMLAHLAGADQC